MEAAGKAGISVSQQAFSGSTGKAPRSRWALLSHCWLCSHTRPLLRNSTFFILVKASCGLAGANPAIVVGNAQPLLVSWLVERQQDARVVLTDAPMADGILEGLARLGLY